MHRRFDRMARLVGVAGLERLQRARVAVIGVGGVGSHAAVSLARSGVGRIALVDFDVICETNVNRQVQARASTAGALKVEVLAEYIHGLHPDVIAEPIPRFFDAEHSDEILGSEGSPSVDYVVDAIDNLTTKCHLLATCHARGIPVVSACGASGRLDPTAVRVADLATTKLDPMAAMVRKILRRKHGFGEASPWGIPAVYSLERAREPEPVLYEGGRSILDLLPGAGQHHTQERRRVIYGTAGFVTGAFGLACASVVVRGLSGA
jgi:tRNA A37 threonylcarbamoyladenosine dehydratase